MTVGIQEFGAAREAYRGQKAGVLTVEAMMRPEAGERYFAQMCTCIAR